MQMLTTCFEILSGLIKLKIYKIVFGKGEFNNHISII
jgi:hypothetical protein